MSTTATDPQDRREQAEPVVSEQQREKTVLNLLLAEEHDYPWSVEELVRMIGPGIRSIRKALERDGLVRHLDEPALQERAQRDCRARTRQRELRSAYFARREREARRSACENGLRAWLRGPAPYYRHVDQRWLAFCTNCREIDFPLPDEKTDRWDNAPKRERRCLVCTSRTLTPWGHEHWRLGDPQATTEEHRR